MAITLASKAPASAGQAIGKALRDLRAPGTFDEAAGRAVHISGGLPVYRLGLDDIVRADVLAHATKVGWRYIVAPPGGGVGYADVKESAKGEARFASLARNRNAERLTEAVHLAEEIAPSLSGDYEARILDVPALFLAALWLDGKQPVFIPFIDRNRLSQTDAAVQAEPDFLPRLFRNASKVRQQFSQAPEATG